MAVFLDSISGTWQLPQGKSVLGRSASCDIVLDDMRLSRQHATIVVEGTTVTIMDQGSANGVLVNHDRIASSTTLQNGDLLITGPFAFRVRIITDQADPSRVKSEAIPKPTTEKGPRQKSSVKGKRTSQEFMPSTDRSTRNTVDMSADDLVNEAPALEFSPGMAPPLANTTPTTSGNRRNISSDIQDALRGESGNRPQAPETPSTPNPKTSEKNRTEALLPDTVNKKTSNALERNDDESGSRIDTSRAMAPRRIPNSRPPAMTRVLCSCFEILLFVFPALILSAMTLVAAVSIARSRVADSQLLDNLLAELGALNLQGFIDVLVVLKAEQPDTFTALFIGSAVALLVVLLCFIFTLVIPISMRGGTVVQRRMGLVTLDNRGWYPSVWRALWRGIWFVLILPVHLLVSALGGGGVHDQLAGCLLRRRDDDEPVHG